MLGNIASIVGLIISIWTLCIAHKVKGEVIKIQAMHLFNRRIDSHLKSIDEQTNKLSVFLDSIIENETDIKLILAKLLTDFESVEKKLVSSEHQKQIKKVISALKYGITKKYFIYQNKYFKPFRKMILYAYNKFGFLATEEIAAIYVKSNENYNRIKQLKLDKKETIK